MIARVRACSQGLAERMNWLGVKPADDPFGKQLIAAGVSAKTIEAWALDPQVRACALRVRAIKSRVGCARVQVVYGPTSITASLFDTLEDTDADECLALCQMISLGPHFKQHQFAHTMVRCDQLCMS
jgi:hypothetical protein